jgi:hypothetical protein
MGRWVSRSVAAEGEGEQYLPAAFGRAVGEHEPVDLYLGEGLSGVGLTVDRLDVSVLVF